MIPLWGLVEFEGATLARLVARVHLSPVYAPLSIKQLVALQRVALQNRQKSRITKPAKESLYKTGKGVALQNPLQNHLTPNSPEWTSKSSVKGAHLFPVHATLTKFKVMGSSTL